MTAATLHRYGGRRREEMAPALIVALILHAGLFAVLYLQPHRASMLPPGNPVPVTIVSDAPKTDSRPAEQAPQVQEASADSPVPDAPPPVPQAAPPKPAPAPVTHVRPEPTPEKPAAKPKPVKADPKPVPKPTPKPKPAPAPAKPAPAKPAPARSSSTTHARASDADFLSSLQASISKSAHTAPARPASAPHRGPTQSELALEARIKAGLGVSQSDIQGLQQLLERLWNPNCSTGGAPGVVKVQFAVGDDGRVIGHVSAQGGDPVASRRAVDAVHQAEPYAAPYRAKGLITVNFDAKKYCASR